MVEGGLKPGRADLAIAVFLALITLIANVTGMPYVLFPELGALGWVNFQRSAPSLGPLAGPVVMLTPFLAAVAAAAAVAAVARPRFRRLAPPAPVARSEPLEWLQR